jgi:pimeloyl-ACP methyl ester carboxylesterase
MTGDTVNGAITSGILEVDGSLYYEVAGPGRGVPLVFLHGGFGNRRMWDAQFTHFAAD